MSEPRLPFAGLAAAADALRAGRLSSRELTDLVLARIAAIEPRIHAFSHVLWERARAEADTVDRRRREGEELPELAGVPIAVKDLIDTVPAVCRAGLPFLAGHRPRRDAAVVGLLRRAGAVVLGVTETDSGAFLVRTPQTRHPQAVGRVVGGSSGGSSAAVAAGLAYAALGTDTGGSIRIPSACCLTVGFKPTRGRVSTVGVRPLAPNFDHVGPMARAAADLPLLQAVLDPRYARTGRPSGERITVAWDPGYGRDAAPEIQAGLAKALVAAATLGASVDEVVLPWPDEVSAIHMHNVLAEAAACQPREWFPGRIEAYPPELQPVLEAARAVPAYKYIEALAARDDLRRRVDRCLAAADYLIVPTLPVLAPSLETESVVLAGVRLPVLVALIRYTCLFNQTGHPVVSLPATVLGSGLGTSVQVVGRRDCDADLLAFAGQLEAALDLAIDYDVAA